MAVRTQIRTGLSGQRVYNRPMSVSETPRRTARIDIRTTEDERVLLVEAAQLTNRTVSEYIRTQALADARRDVEAARRFVLSPQAWDAFVEALEHPDDHQRSWETLRAVPRPWAADR